MSYRAFKRLLGETSLERKCRFLFGSGVVLLIFLSFSLYAYQTEHLAYEQTVTTCRLLVAPILVQQHVTLLKNDSQHAELPKHWRNLDQAVLKEPGREYQYHFLSDKFDDSYETELYKEFQKGDGKPDDHRQRAGDQVLLFYSPIRVSSNCLACHQEIARKKDKTLAENDLLAMVRIRMPTKNIEDGVHWNRAILATTAIATAILIMVGSWIIVRYIIVKPVKHLKDVSDAISAGELNVRSEIQTGDEFEDLSHAFNRMLRHLVAMQDQWRKVNADLDRKVDELAQTNMALFESNKLKGDFLATMSHELRTPLNSILGFSDVLLSGESLTDKQRRWMSNIQTSGQKLLNLINDILDLAKIESGKMQVRLDNFNLHDVCEGVLNMFRPLAEKKNIDMRSQIEPDIPGLRQDITKLQQILQNLLSNAIKFTPEGGRVQLKAEADTKYVTIAVMDTGVGVAKDEQDLVFQKFRQSGNPLTREHAGTGLGLSIVRELCKLLGGEVTLHSELGRGSTFTVRLPMQLNEEPRLEFDLAAEQIELARAQRVDTRVYANAPSTTLDRHETTVMDGKPSTKDTKDTKKT
ncbi:MAG: HAMP domain-containing protein [Planctomycetes bacterium]|nr:HAMP domain-containing protein [Planctomycetota bacterium]